MARVILTCGRICSGKSTYAKKLRETLQPTAILSVDEIMLTLFGQNAGEQHDAYVERLEDYLFQKSLELVASGIHVILDLGLWTKSERQAARNFYAANGITCEIHYLSVSDAVWHTRIAARNRAVQAGEATAYFVDETLAQKVSAWFEPPTQDEIDVWISCVE